MITKSMYSRAIRLQDEQELLPIAYILNTWLKIIEDDFNERGLGGTALNKHPLVIMLVRKMFSLVFPKSVKSTPKDLRIIPGVYLRFLTQWLINVLNEYTCEASLTVVDGKFLNFDQLVQWIILCMAGITQCTHPCVYDTAWGACSYVTDIPDDIVITVLKEESQCYFINIPVALPMISSKDLHRILQVFQQVTNDVLLIQVLNKNTFPVVAEQKRRLTLC